MCLVLFVCVCVYCYYTIPVVNCGINYDVKDILLVYCNFETIFCLYLFLFCVSLFDLTEIVD